MSKQYVIFDLDNCLADDSARIPLIDWDKSDPTQRYARYHAACGQDPLVNEGVFFEHFNRGRFPIFITGRPTTVKRQTLDWLHDKLGLKPGDYELLMRPAGDDRASVDVKAYLLRALPDWNIPLGDVVVAYDDRDDILRMYRDHGIRAMGMCAHDVCAYTNPNRLVQIEEPPKPPKPPVTAADILGEMHKTFLERQSVYKDNYKMVAKLVAVLFPNGVPSELVVQDQWHLFELALVKISRYAISELTHIDSAHDCAVYMAMCEAINHNQQRKGTAQ